MNNYFQQQSFRRFLPTVREALIHELSGCSYSRQTAFLDRYDRTVTELAEAFFSLYGDQADAGAAFHELAVTLAKSWKNRSSTLAKSDALREQNPRWFIERRLNGAVCYVDLWAGTFKELEKKIPYLTSLGINYLHLMPVFNMPREENDGGYAVSSYRETAPGLGTFNQLKKLLNALRKGGILTVLDFINNHTSDEHPWAKAAVNGEVPYNDFYYLFEDRTMPNRFEPALREIFPEVRRGSFTYNETMHRWVWTTFHNYQWDLNYRNPHLLAAIIAEMLHLANAGVDILRLDAVPFTWKEEGTSCENLEQAHTLIRILNRCAIIAAPGLLFKSEAIVHPDDVIRYVTPEKCQLSYNPTLMATLWESLATRSTRLLQASIRRRFHLPENTSWVNYVRSHDDIGWTFSDDDARELGLDPTGHRDFLNRFYCGLFNGSFARGLSFQYNPENGDRRICGTTASLCGIEEGLRRGDEAYTMDGVNRLLLMYGISCSIGGIPLLYLGDEWAVLNDMSFLEDPGKASDHRWVHRVSMDWARATLPVGSSVGSLGSSVGSPSPTSHRDPQTDAAIIIFEKIRRMFQIRKEWGVFSENQVQVVDHPDPAILLYCKGSADSQVCVAANFSEEEKVLGDELAQIFRGHGMMDLLSGECWEGGQSVHLYNYDIRWFTKSPD